MGFGRFGCYLLRLFGRSFHSLFNGFLDLLLGSDHFLFHTRYGVGGSGYRLGGNYGINGLGGGRFGFLGQTLGFALTTTYFTRVVGGAAAAGRRLSSFLGLRYGNRSFFRGSCDRRFCHDFGGCCFHGLGSFHHGRGLLYYRHLFVNRGGFNGLGNHGFCGRCFNDSFGIRGFHLGRSFSAGLGNHFSGNNSGSGYGSGLDGVGRSGLFGTFLIRAQLFTIGFALTLATVAATALATGATTGTLAIGTFLIVVLQQFFVVQQFFVDHFRLGHFGARLALLSGLTVFTRLTFFAGRTLGSLTTLTTTFLTFARFAGFTRLTLFTRLAFLAGLTLLTGLALFARLACQAFLAGLTLFTRLALFAGWTFSAFAAFATSFLAFTGFARLALFARLAIFLATAFTTFTGFTAVTTAVLLTAVATLVTARLALGRRLLGFDLGLFLAGEQTHQGLHQAFEQARLRSRCRRCQRGRWSRGRGRTLGDTVFTAASWRTRVRVELTG